MFNSLDAEDEEAIAGNLGLILKIILTSVVVIFTVKIMYDCKHGDSGKENYYTRYQNLTMEERFDEDEEKMSNKSANYRVFCSRSSAFNKADNYSQFSDDSS